MLGAKKVYNKCKCEKMRKADSAALNRYLKIELLVKIVTDCKLSTIFAILGVVLSSPLTTINQCFLRTTRLISSYFETIALTTYRDFTTSKSTKELLKH